MKKTMVLGCIASLFLSCSTFLGFFTEEPSAPSSPSNTDTVQSSAVSAVPNLPSTIQEQSAMKYWITIPSDNTLVIVGVSNTMRTQDTAITAAKEDAAWKVAMFHGFHGNIESIHRSGNANFFDHVGATSSDVTTDNDYTIYIDKLNYDPEKDVVVTDEAVFVRFRYSTAVPAINFSATFNNEGRPNWTFSRDLPQFDGYVTAVGFAQNQRYTKETIRKSVESAALQMIANMSTQIETSDMALSGAGAVSQIRSTSEGSFNNFKVLEIWIDPNTGYAYTLAIARQSR